MDKTVPDASAMGRQRNRDDPGRLARGLCLVLLSWHDGRDVTYRDTFIVGLQDWRNVVAIDSARAVEKSQSLLEAHGWKFSRERIAARGRGRCRRPAARIL